MEQIKEYKELSTIKTFDWEDITTTATVGQILDQLNTKKFIRIGGDMIINTSSIKQVTKKKVQIGLEEYIGSLELWIKQKVIEKRKRLKKKMWKEMTLSYARNYVEENF